MKVSKTISPFLSLLIIFSFLLVVLLIKMENRKWGYKLLKLYTKEKKAREDKRYAQAKFAGLASPERIRKLATKLYSYESPQKGQVVKVATKGKLVVE